MTSHMTFFLSIAFSLYNLTIFYFTPYFAIAARPLNCQLFELYDSSPTSVSSIILFYLCLSTLSALMNFIFLSHFTLNRYTNDCFHGFLVSAGHCLCRPDLWRGWRGSPLPALPAQRLLCLGSRPGLPQQVPPLRRGGRAR